MCAVVVEQLDAVSCAVAAQGSDLCLGVCADVRQAAVGLRGQGRSGMVERGLGQLGTTGAQAARVELGESLRRGDLVGEVQVDVEDRGRRVALWGDAVGIDRTSGVWGQDESVRVDYGGGRII